MAEFAEDEEILEFAIVREVDSNLFYLKLAARVKDPEMRKMFMQLADEELEHKAKLELELMKLGRVVGDKPGEPGEQGILNADETDLDVTYRDMLIMGMKKEETSFRLYVDLAGRVTDPGSKETLLSLAEEEVRHKLRFQMEYEKVLKEE